ncbi:MAG: 3-phosphoshikimate 1-carboxyvinyltransferase [Bacteroidales bacterium]
MKKKSLPSVVEGYIQAPPSKSAAQRAIAIATLAKGTSIIVRPGAADDVMAAMDVSRKLGASVKEVGEDVHITGGIHPPEAPLHCRESGLSIRMFSGIASLFSEEVQMTGQGSLLARPMEVVAASLQAVGVHCITTDGKLPLYIRGPIKGGKVSIDGSLSSQALTGILIAAPYAKEELSLHVSQLKSKPYIDLTINVMKAFGVETINEDYRHFTIPPGQFYKACGFTTEGDWSGAAFLLVAGAIAGKVVVDNLIPGSFQGDKRILDALKSSGARVKGTGEGFCVERNKLNAFAFDATDCPDLFPPLAALAAHCQGISRIRGVSRLRAKESDRAATLKDIFAKMGITIRLEKDSMLVEGGKPKAASVSSHGDHRIAMAAAVTALAGTGPVIIEGAEAVNKSYPGFFNDLETITK